MAGVAKPHGCITGHFERPTILLLLKGLGHRVMRALRVPGQVCKGPRRGPSDRRCGQPSLADAG